jgi:hypothetical protein
MNLVNPYRFAAAGNTDPYFSSVVLLLHCDGTNGATSATDYSNSAHSITFYGNAQLSDTSPKFGTAAVLFDGSGDYIQAPDSADWDFGTGDFTIEFWYKSTTNTSDPGTFVSQYNGNGFTFRWYLGALYMLNGATTIATGGSWTPTTGVWYHIAACRSGTSLRLFVDGTQSGSTATSSDNITGSNLPLELGCMPYSGGHIFPLNGRLDDVRITKGVARYTANFTAPTEAFPNS